MRRRAGEVLAVSRPAVRGSVAAGRRRSQAACAAQLGLDTAQFNACVDTQKYRAEIDVDIRAGDEAGVSGTPAFYINGRMLSGAQPFEAFKRIIDEELARNR